MCAQGWTNLGEHRDLSRKGSVDQSERQ